MDTFIQKQKGNRLAAAVLAGFVFLTTGATASAAVFELQGVSKGETNWIAGNVQDWRELDYIPCRIAVSGPAFSQQSITIVFPHITGTTPGFQNLYGFTASGDVSITSPPVLSAPIGEDWSYTFTIDFAGGEGYVTFEARLAAGAHLNTGSSLMLRGLPSSMGNLQVHKPSPGPGLPDLALVKTGPAVAGPGDVLEYTLSYTNQAVGSNEATGVQISDILPPELTVVDAAGGAVQGNTIFWDLPDMDCNEGGSLSFTAQVSANAVYGQRITNYAQALCSQDDADYSDNSSEAITTIIFNRKPEADDQSVTTPEDTPVLITLTGSDPDGDAITFVLFAAPTNGVLSGFDANTGEVLYMPGTNYVGGDSFKFRVRDGSLQSAWATVWITVTSGDNDAPVADDQNVSTPEDTPLAITLTGNDPDGDVITYELLNSPTNGVLSGFDANTGEVLYTPGANYVGGDRFTFRVSDGLLQSEPATVWITVTSGENNAPVADDQNVTTPEDTPVLITLTGSDPDGDALTFVLFAAPTNGVLSGFDANTGEVTYTPGTNYVGGDSFKFRVRDGSLQSAWATVWITVISGGNDAPVADDQAVTTAEDTPLAITLTGSDPNGDAVTYELLDSPTNGVLSGFDASTGAVTYTPGTNYVGGDSFTFRVSDGLLESAPATVWITVTSGDNDGPVADDQNVTTVEDTSLPITLTGSDPDGDVITYELLDNPTNGVLSGFDANTGAVTYAPGTNYVGGDSFTFRVSDGLLQSEPATVWITVTSGDNDAPMADDQSVTTPEDTPLAITLTGSDPDGDVITYELLDNPTNGVLSGFDANTGAVTYTPGTNYVGGDSFTFRVSDGLLQSAPATVWITVTSGDNDAPVADDQSVTTVEDTPLLITLTGSDPDGDVITYELLDNPTNGVLSGFDANTGAVTYAPGTNYVGGDSFTFRVSDGLLQSQPATVWITVTSGDNDAPVADDQNVTTVEDTPLPITLTGSDPDGDVITYELLDNPTNGVLSGFDANTGAVTYAPGTNYVGGDSFTFRVSDGLLQSAPATVWITVTSGDNDAPVADDQNVSTAEDTSVAITLTGSDPDGDVITYELLDNSTNGVLSGFDANTGEVLYTPGTNYVGGDRFTFRVSDGLLQSHPATVWITVIGTNNPPVVPPEGGHWTVLEDHVLDVESPGLLSGASDPDGDTLSVVLVSGTTNGVLQVSSNGAFQYQPAPDYFGEDGFEYRVSDGTLLSTSVFATLAVLPVNDAPSFTKGADQFLQMNEGQQSVPGWASSISPGPTNEMDQTVAFQVEADTPSLFTQQPEISVDGTLTYTPAADQWGEAVISVVLQDDGGTENGGEDTSALETFRITINSPPQVSITHPLDEAVFVAPTVYTVAAAADDPDGTITRLELYASTNLVGVYTNAGFGMIQITNLVPGIYEYSAYAEDDRGAAAWSEPVTVTVLDAPPISDIGFPQLNLTTGLYEHRVCVSNPSYFVVNGIMVLVTNLPAGAEVINATGETNGVPYVLSTTALAPGGEICLILEYFVPSATYPNPTLTVELAPSAQEPVQYEGVGQHILRLLVRPRGGRLVEFRTAADRLYVIEYSDDLTQWKTSQPPVLGDGSVLQWLDLGQPKTDQPPWEVPARFYRLILLP